MSHADHSAKVSKTNAARLLDSLDIAYELRAYEVDPQDPAALTAISVARKINLPPAQVFKTLLAQTNQSARGRGEGARGREQPDHLFAIVPGDAELDPKKLAAVAGVRKVELAALKHVEPLTGYIRGGVTVLAAKKAFPAFADEAIELFDVISVSAGQRGLQLVLSPADYLRATGCTLADITRPAGPNTHESAAVNQPAAANPPTGAGS